MNSIIRPRRLRRTEAIREMVRENHLTASDFIYPLFIHEKDFKEEISAMPGTYRWDINGLIKEVTRAWELGIRCVVLFPCLLYTSPSPRDKRQSRMPSSA